MSSTGVVRLGEADSLLLQEWRDLVVERGMNASLDPGWTRVIVDTIDRAHHTVYLWTWRESGTLRAAIPFFRSRQRVLGVSMRTLELASNLMSYHAELASRDSCEDALRRFLQQQEAWDVFRACNVPDDSATAHAIAAVARANGGAHRTLRGDASPYLPIGGSWSDYLSTRHKKFRYKLRKRADDLRANPDLNLRWFTAESECDALLEAILAVERRSWKTTQGMDISSRDFETEYHRRLLPHLAREGMLVAVVLFAAARPIAYSLCASSRGWFGHLKTSFDEEFAAVSAGGIVIDASVERAFSSGASEFDFLGHDAPHKLAWTERVRRHADHMLVAPTIKARLVHGVRDVARAARARLRMATPKR